MLVFCVIYFVGLAVAGEVGSSESNLDVYVINRAYWNQANHNQQNKKPQNVVAEIFQKPVLILAPSKEKQTDLVAYYADHGLESVVDYENFDPLYQLLRKSGPVSGLLLSYHAFNGNQFLLTAVSEFILPDGFKVSDIIRDVQNKAVPILYVAPRNTFNNQRFVGLHFVARFVVGEDSVDSVPVHVSNNAAQQFNYNDFHYTSHLLHHGYHPPHHGFIYYPNQQVLSSLGKPSQDQQELKQQKKLNSS